MVEQKPTPCSLLYEWFRPTAPGVCGVDQAGAVASVVDCQVGWSYERRVTVRF